MTGRVITRSNVTIAQHCDRFNQPATIIRTGQTTTINQDISVGVKGTCPTRNLPSIRLSCIDIELRGAETDPGASSVTEDVNGIHTRQWLKCPRNLVNPILICREFNDQPLRLIGTFTTQAIQ